MENLVISEDKEQFQKEQDQLLKTLLQLRFFNPWQLKTTFDDNRSLQNDANLELYVTSACNQNCEYCYLVKYPDIYPPEYTKPELIIKNLRILLDHFIEKNYFIPTIDCFSGEIWHTKLGWDVLETILEYADKGLNFGGMMIASNCYFINKPETFQRMEHYITEFNRRGHSLFISVSVDGAVIDDYDRPRNNKDTYTDDFYDNLFAFVKHHNYGFHPMIAAKNIHLWPENYKWWKAKLKEYNMRVGNKLMMLEVRNNDWDETTIKQYCEFMKMVMDDFIETECDGNKAAFANLVASCRYNECSPIEGYIPWMLGEADDFIGCTISNHLTVRLGDLAICPCHRQAYEKYLYGRFVVENDKIVDIKSINPYMAVKILMGNTQSVMHGCDTCEFRKCCLKGCHGSQLETNRDPFMPIESVCIFFKEKYRYILNYYKELGIIDYFRSFSPKEYNYRKVKFLLDLYDSTVGGGKRNGLGQCRCNIS